MHQSIKCGHGGLAVRLPFPPLAWGKGRGIEGFSNQRPTRTLFYMTDQSHSTTRSQYILANLPIALLLISWLACYLAWVATKGAGLSVNLYDLAEWMSLDPIVRASNPPLLTTFVLRAVPGLIAVALVNGLAAWGSRPLRWSLRGLALLIGIGLLPPFDFFRGESANPNYHQQFSVAIVTCIAVLIGWWRPTRPIGWISAGLTAIGGCAGMYLSLRQYTALSLSAGIGIGAPVTIAGVLVALLIGVVTGRKEPHPQPSLRNHSEGALPPLLGEALSRADSQFGRFLDTIFRRCGRLQRMKQLAGDRGDLINRRLVCGLVDR